MSHGEKLIQPVLPQQVLPQQVPLQQVLPHKRLVPRGLMQRDLKQRGLEQGGVEAGVELRLQGATATLLRLLRTRFGELPDAIVDGLQHADVEELDRCAERLLDARSLDEVFAR